MRLSVSIFLKQPTIKGVFLAFAILLPIIGNGQTDSLRVNNELYHRDYTLIYGIKYDVLNSTENFRTGLKLFNDAYYRGFGSHISNKTVRGITGFTWSFLVKWSSMLWPHEFGHMLRTNQVGGDFSFEKFAFPGVIGILKLPNNATPEHHTLSLVGGFEANYITARDIQFDFFRYNGMYNDEFGLAFGHRIMYPLYAFGFAPQNPKDPETWIKSGGDPVNFTKLVWEMGNRAVINPDGSVNKELVSFYNNAALISIFWNLIDLNTYRQAGAFFGNELAGKRPKFFGNNSFSWSYGTLFNTSVLGAELYLNNYVKLNNRFYSFYLKYGFPFKNNGIGLSTPNIINIKTITIDLQADIWSQYIYGNGFSVNTTAQYILNSKLNIIAQIGYKSKGYLVGRTSQDGIIGFFGLKYNLHN
jgi:hypothetical protein